MTAIERLWEEWTLPLRDALHYADGRSYDIALTPATPTGFTVLGPFDLAGTLKDDPSWVSSVDGLTVADLGEQGQLWAGEGSYGSEGFLARLTTGRALMWAVFFTESNPFDGIRVAENVATFRSTLGIEIAVDIEDPRRWEGRTA